MGKTFRYSEERYGDEREYRRDKNERKRREKEEKLRKQLEHEGNGA